MAFISKVGNILKQSVSKHFNSELSASNPSIFQAIRCMSSSKLFIGGLSYNTDDTSLRDAFAAHGEVIEARVIMDRETGRSRGFGFVSFTSIGEASSAIQAMDGQELHGRRVVATRVALELRTARMIHWKGTSRMTMTSQMTMPTGGFDQNHFLVVERTCAGETEQDM
ncbi:RNA recognition motif domain [Macleaya cordata]|uniref:RNA recognition motif domain n=1 Tax=Macleaya cordata TaxID=56857 RepID=A0A200PRF1_MACCD|nr:RNA recognition motif domain [Macleaya cordata]